MVPLEMAARLAEPLASWAYWRDRSICGGNRLSRVMAYQPFDPRDHQRRALTCAVAWVQWGTRADGSYPTPHDPSLKNRRELNGWGDVGLLVMRDAAVLRSLGAKPRTLL